MEQSSKRILYIGVPLAIGVFVAAFLATSAAKQGQTQQASAEEIKQKRIAQLLGNDLNKISDPQWRQLAMDTVSTDGMPNARLLIFTNTSWSGAAQGSDLTMTTIEGNGYYTKTVTCEHGGIYSVTIQKQTEGGSLLVAIAQNGNILKQSSTTAAYGVVSVAGTCD